VQSLVRWVAGVHAPRAIAVLPFKNLGTEPDSEAVVDGLTLGIMQQLAGIDGLRLTSQTSSYLFRDMPRDLNDVRRRLGTDLVIEGTATFSAGMLAADARLTQGANDELWSGRFNQAITSPTEITAVQEAIVRAIVNRLRLSLGHAPKGCETLLSLSDYGKLVKAQRLTARRHSVHAREAVELFEDIVARQPACAVAWAGWPPHSQKSSGCHRPKAPFRFRRISTECSTQPARAVHADQGLAEAHAALGCVYASRQEWKQAEAAFQHALQLNPSDTIAHTNYVLSTLYPQARLADALRYLDEALEVDPAGRLGHHRLRLWPDGPARGG
jgi:adenylate cyclase